MQLPHLSVFSLIKRVFRDALKPDFDNGITYIVKDKLPDGMTFIDGSQKAYIADSTRSDIRITYTEYQPNTIAPENIEVIKNADGTITFKVVNTELKYNDNYPAIVIVYKAKLTTNKAMEIASKVEATQVLDEKFSNTASVDMYKNYGTGNQELVAKTNEDTANLFLRSEQTAPGVEKSGATAEAVWISDFECRG